MSTRKIFSFILVLSLVLCALVYPAPIVNAADPTPEEVFFNILLEKFSNLKNIDDALKMVTIIEAIDDEDTLMTSIEAALDEDEAAKTILLNNGFTEGKISEIITVIRAQFPSLDSINLEDPSTSFFVALLLDSDPQYAEYSSELKAMAEEVYDILPQEVKDDLGRYVQTKDEKIAFFLEFANEFINSKIGAVKYDVTNQKYTDINLSVPNDFKSAANELLSSPLEGQTAIQLTDAHIASLNMLLDVIEAQIGTEELSNDAGYILYKASLVTKTDYNKPSDGGTPGGGGGGGGSAPVIPTTPSPSEPVVPNDPSEPVIITVGGDSVTTTTSNGTVNVTVNADSTVEAIESVAEAAEGRNAQVVIEIDDTANANLSVSLPSNVIASLQENSVDLVISSNGIEYNVPVEALAGLDIPEGASVEFNSRELSSEEISNLNANTEGTVSSVVELSLQVVSGDDAQTVKSFGTYIVIKLDVSGLGDSDKLGVYYINEETGELEFVGGKVKDGKIILRTNHYSKYAIVESNKTFADVAGHWSKAYVESMAAKQVIGGMGDGTFNPEGKVTRAELAKMVVNALELDLVSYTGGFGDVSEDEWYASYVATAKAAGLVTGYDDGTFKPNQQISRVEMAALLSRTLDDVDVTAADVASIMGSYTDSLKIDNWAAESVTKAVKSGLMNGMGNRLFSPESTTTRAEAATAIYRLYNR